MRYCSIISAFLFVATIINAASAGSPGSATVPQRQMDSSPVFIRNNGQISNPAYQYVLAARHARLYFSSEGIEMVLPESGKWTINESDAHRVRSESAAPAFRRLSLRLKGANPDIALEPADQSSERYHFYSNAHPGGITGVPAYNTLVYRNVYNQIDLRFTVTNEGLKYEFIVHPGGDPASIRLEYEGTEALLLTPEGKLSVQFRGGSLTDAAPVSYLQNMAGDSIGTSYRIEGNEYGFDVSGFDRTKTLVIDPCIMWSSFYGGSTSDIASDVAADPSGNIILTGFTSSIDFPADDKALQTSSAGSIDAFIVKVSPDGKRIWATYYGGTGSEDWPHAAVDPGGNIFLAGYTSSLDFPVSQRAYQRENGGKIDAFLVKLSPHGTRVWSTLFGGSFAEECSDVATDGAGSVYITGSTFSTNLPVNESAHQTSNQGDFDGFIAKFDSEGALLWSTYLGGWSLDYCTGIAVGPTGNIAVTGYTESKNFTVSPNAFQTDHKGGRYDGFICMMTTNGRRLWSSFYGGADEDQGAKVAFGPDGSVYICGNTKSSDVTTLGNGQNTAGGSHDAFIASFNAQGDAQWSSYYGGNGGEQATDICVDSKNLVYVCGFKIGGDFPGAEKGFKFDTPNSMDAFLIRFDHLGTRLWATAYGGPLGDLAYGIALDDKGNIVMIGETGSKQFPTTGATLQTHLAGYEDGFLVKFLFYEPLVEAGDDVSSCADQGVELEATVTQGIPPYTYQWSPAAGLDNPASPKPRCVPDKTTTYTVTVTDAYGCIGSDTVTVTVNERPTVDPGPNLEICPGGSTMLAANVAGGSQPYKYEWSPKAGLNETNIATPKATPKVTTTYTILVTDAKGCTHRDSVTVFILPPPIADAGENRVVCLGAFVRIGTEAAGGTPPYAYQWSPRTGLNSETIATPEASPAKTTIYRLTVTDAKGCTSTDTVTVKVLPALNISAGKDQTICYGETTTISTKTEGGKGPFTYIWNPTTDLTDPASSTTKASPLQTTEYTVTVTDASGCTASSTVVISVRNQLFVDAGQDARICEGSQQQIGGDAHGGEPPYSYSWKPLKGLTSPKSATPLASPTETTTYVVTVTDGAGCTTTDSVTLSVMERPKPMAMKDVTLCKGFSIKIDATVKDGTPPYTYSWNPPFGLDGSNILSPTAQPAQTVTYVLSVTDANGCTGADSVTITVRPVPQLSEGKTISICRGATAEIGSEASGGTPPYRYSWTPDDNISSTSSAVTKVRPKNATTYSLTVTDANGCTATVSYTVQVLDCPSGDAGSDARTCLGESVQLGGETSGGEPPYSYEWSPAAGLNSFTDPKPVAQPAASTVYELTITDANGCKYRDSVRVTIDPPPDVSAGGDRTICSGATVELEATVKGGFKPFEYFWTPADQLDISNQPVFRPTPAASTMYYVTVSDANGCRSTDSVFVTVAPPLAVDAGANTAVCKGGSYALMPSVAGGTPPYGYAWTQVKKADAKNFSPSISPAQSAWFTLTVTDAIGCIAKDSVFVEVESLPTPVISVSRPAVCEGDTVQLTVEGTYARYDWSNGAAERQITVTQPGIFFVRGYNERGCMAESQKVRIDFNSRPRPEISIKGGTTLCSGNRTVLSVKQKYASYRWSDGSMGNSITVTTAGSYFVEVADKNGCTGVSAPVEITVVPSPVAAIEKRSDTLVAAEAAQYQWLLNNRSIKGATGNTFIPKKTGRYAVRIKSENGCEAVSEQIQISIPRQGRRR